MTKTLKHSSGTIDFSKSGNAFLVSDSKAVTKDIFIPKSKTGKALNGDTVFMRLIPKKDSPDEYVGEVVGIVKRFRTEFVGVLEQSQDGKFIVLKTISKRMPVEFIIPSENMATATVGDKVLIKLSRWHKGENKPIGVVKQVFGKAGEHSTEMNSILFENNIDSTFPENVLAEAEVIPFEIPADEILKREDFRDTIVFTIDPVDAKDFDDALSFKALGNNIYEIGVHIADVGHYMKAGSILDREAYRRSTSTYLVDRVIPMLPERLSNGVCSLRPNEEKLVFSVIFTIEHKQPGETRVLSERFVKGVIKSGKRYSYEEAQDVIEKRHLTDKFDTAVIYLDDMAKKFRAKRFLHGAVSFEKREVKFKLDADKYPIGVYLKESKNSNKLIEEFMLLANQFVATHIGKKGLPCIYRTHALPTQERLQELSVFVEQFGHKLEVTDSEEQNKKSLNKLLLDVKDSNHANIVETVALRSMSKAIYTTEVLGHYGLGFKYYSHFTSPIRRYPDVILHRLLFNLITYKNISAPNLQTQCKHCSELENKAAKAERESIKFKQVEYIRTKVGFEFEGVVSGASPWGLFVEIKENGCEGAVNSDELLNLGFSIDEKNYRFISGENKIALGDTVKVRVNGVNLTKRQIDLSLVL